MSNIENLFHKIDDKVLSNIAKEKGNYLQGLANYIENLFHKIDDKVLSNIAKEKGNYLQG
ncbi:hypothetical protein HZY83_03180, partial [Gemella sp. GH3]|nr:hypothetical protein [Gemella sp. GH3.1]NYS50635.1 hypothetical protein [Gemella sp. GH3]